MDESKRVYESIKWIVVGLAFIGIGYHSLRTGKVLTKNEGIITGRPAKFHSIFMIVLGVGMFVFAIGTLFQR
jgi:hypothetical protein